MTSVNPNPCMYIFLNQSLKMSTGKAAAQVAHAALNAYHISNPDMISLWEKGGHYTKIVLLAENAEALDTYERYINDRGFKTALIIDEGRTEIARMSRTAMGVEIVDKNDRHTVLTFGEFQTYKDLAPTPTTLSEIGLALPTEYLSRKGRKRRQEIEKYMMDQWRGA